MLMLILNQAMVNNYYENFNTSHVNVNRLEYLLKKLKQYNFNTSHVNVNHC